jgi:hypothetical protein
VNNCHLCSALIEDRYKVCFKCSPKFRAWQAGKRDLRAKSMARAQQRRSPDDNAHKPWAGLFDKRTA